ncbi:MAG: hypothetical protein C0483_21595 [Pirellula sp.]|nr:hypothetical protein [Pirellula sp.]
MSTSSRPQSADPSAIGYYFQGQYALVVISTASDDAVVSIETADDVEVQDGITSLHQIKHSLGAPATLSLVDVGLWKAILNWSGRPHDGTEEFVFVTCASLASELALLTERGNDRTALVTAMLGEAMRVRLERAQAKADKKKKLPHEKRFRGCEAFLNLSIPQQSRLVNLIRVVPDSFDATQVSARLQTALGSCLPPKLREQIFERLIEWWDRQVALSLLGTRKRQIAKLEVQTHLCKLVNEHYPESLPNHFGLKTPEGDDTGLGRIMEKQIEWVDGGKNRLARAALARWRARNQRERWIKDDISMAATLIDYDMQLKEKWSDRFGPMCDDCDGKAEKERTGAGLLILEWSHISATTDIAPIRESWPHSFLIQGSLQQLAEEGEVGWHPDYVDKLKALKKEGDK